MTPIYILTQVPVTFGTARTQLGPCCLYLTRLTIRGQALELFVVAETRRTHVVIATDFFSRCFHGQSDHNDQQNQRLQLEIHLLSSMVLVSVGLLYTGVFILI